MDIADSSETDSDCEYSFSQCNTTLLSTTIDSVKQHNVCISFPKPEWDRIMGTCFNTKPAGVSSAPGGSANPGPVADDLVTSPPSKRQRVRAYSARQAAPSCGASAVEDGVDPPEIAPSLHLTADTAEDELNAFLSLTALHQRPARILSGASCSDSLLVSLSDSSYLTERTVLPWLSHVVLVKLVASAVPSAALCACTEQLSRRFPSAVCDRLLVPLAVEDRHIPADLIYRIVHETLDQHNCCSTIKRVCDVPLTECSVSLLLLLLERINPVADDAIVAALVSACCRSCCHLSASPGFSKLVLAVLRRCPQQLTASDVTRLTSAAAQLSSALARAVQAACRRIAAEKCAE